jgi:glyoxylase-like metal-dependent hydrolase (beta-lactamase superfamily II)
MFGSKFKSFLLFKRFMLFEQLNETGWAMTYLVVDEGTNEAALIDPVYDFLPVYLDRLKTSGLVLKYAIATHMHADHITACFSLSEQVGCRYLMWKSTSSLGVNQYVDDEEKVMLGGIPIQFHHCPGHTSDSMIVQIPGRIMTGDFLFNGEGGVGRDDLPGGRLEVHWESLAVLERFPGDTLVCSGHEPPGTEMMSLDWNRIHNPILNMDTFEAFKEWQESTAERLGTVSKIKIAVPANLFAEIPDIIPWMQ